MYNLSFQLLCWSGLTNSITMHVMLSVPRPSDAARLLGQILSSIDSTIFDIYMPLVGYPTMAEPPLTRGDTVPDPAIVLELDLLSPRADTEPIFLDGEAPAFLT